MRPGASVSYKERFAIWSDHNIGGITSTKRDARRTGRRFSGTTGLSSETNVGFLRLTAKSQMHSGRHLQQLTGNLKFRVVRRLRACLESAAGESPLFTVAAAS
jgi:hypothetical protein